MTVQSPKDFANELDTLFRGQCAWLNLDEPWFGRFALEKGGDKRSYFVGKNRHPDERIIDWRHPLAKAFYDTAPGEEFELDAPHFAKVNGTVESRCSIASAERRIRKLEMMTKGDRIVLVAGEEGFVYPEETATARAAQAGLSDILGLITPEQYRLITQSRGRPVIIQGRAGSGKTSVALYRVAFLTWPSEDPNEAPVDPSRVLIVMFNRALSTFVGETLKDLKLEEARLDTFHAWALDAIRSGYRGQIEVDTSDYPGKRNAVLLKKQLGILHATEAFVERQARALDRWLEDKLAPYDRQGEYLKQFRELSLPIVRRVALMRTRALRERRAATSPREERRFNEMHVIFQRAMTRLTLYKEELLRLLSDKELLARHLTEATPEQIDDLIRYQTALQGGGAKSGAGANIAFEDFAILLRLMQLKNGGLPNKDRDDEVHVFDHLVIDEAQDFGAVELTVLLNSVRSRTGVTIVGDLNQKIVPEADFVGWEALAEELGVSGAEVAKLEVAHRSTAPIMALADHIVGDEPSPGREGVRPALALVDPEDVHARAASIIREAVQENANGHICVIIRRANQSRPSFEAIRDQLAGLPVPVRFGHNREFVFESGVTVTNMRQVKGLEFDTVIVLDPTDANYPDTEAGRRALYTMVTRAKDALHFIGSEAPGSIVQAAIDAGLVDLYDETDIPPVSFDDEDDEPF